MDIIAQLQALAGVCAVGVCDFETVRAQVDCEKVARFVDRPARVLVALFPYAVPARVGNVSRYARGLDYHVVITRALEPFALQLQQQYPTHQFKVLVDASPLPEVLVAASCGLGKLGDNGLLIHPKYGSAVFIGTILTDFPFPTTAKPVVERCLQCGACARACPVGLDHGRCLSALTQQNGALTEVETALIQVHSMVWGCDICQDCCPMNRQVQTCDNPDFTQNLLCNLSVEMVENLTRRQFQQKFANRAFTWRGPSPILRNLLLQQRVKSQEKDCNTEK